MFSIVSTQKIIEKLYPEDSVWGNIVSQTQCFYLKLNTDWSKEDDKPLSDLYRNGAKIIDGAELFEKLEKNPEVIADYPTSVFILEIEEKKASSLQQKYGVIIQSFSKLNDSILTTVSKKTFYTEKGSSCKGWPEVLSGLRGMPINSIIINDRNLFTNDERSSDSKPILEDSKLSGINNVYNILNIISPRALDVPFHVLIICEKKEEGGHLSANKIASLLNKVRKGLNRSYTIVMELLVITKASPFYNESHNRRILTNYGLLTFDHKVSAFVSNKSNATQIITVNKLFSQDNLNERSPYAQNHAKLLKELNRYYNDVKASSKLKEHEFFKNGTISIRFDQTEHRMIIK